MFSFLQRNKIQSILTITTKTSRLRDENRKRFTIVTVRHNGKEIFFLTQGLTKQKVRSFPLAALHYVLEHSKHTDFRSILKNNVHSTIRINDNYFEVSDLSI